MPGVISTNPARCRDCYRCVRTCPVKAVRVSGGQAEVVPELCIACASCVRACPQQAKVVRDEQPLITAALAAGRPVVASIAPSAPAFFDLPSFAPMEAALAGLGFAAAHETAVAAEMTGQAHGELVATARDRWPLVASACPVVINLVEQYYPDLIPHLAPIVSPMVAHGRYLHQVYGPEAFVVFIGPCIAKKDERLAAPLAGAIDAALTFDELANWLAATGATWEAGLPDGDPRPGVRPAASSVARLFPVEGGLVGTARLDTDLLSGHVLTGSGIGTCLNVLEGIRQGSLEACLVELMACSGGCINGPVFAEHASVAVARQRVMAYARRRGPLPVPPRAEWPSLDRAYADRSIPVPAFSEEQIRAALAAVDKFKPEDELNCGSCGYPSCREKAAATLRGMAEPTMCIPYMRARAESLNDVVIEATPNAILIVDRDLRIQDLSPSAAQMFKCSRVIARGQPLAHIMPVLDDFETVRRGESSVMNKIVRIPAAPDRGRAELVVEASIVPVQGENLLVAILRDVTEREAQRLELERIRSEAILRSQEVINKQMRVAHEIAGLLGETTAETKVLLRQLTRLMEEQS